MDHSHNILQRGIGWIQTQASRLIRTFSSPEKERKQSNEILKFPNLKNNAQLARSEGLRRAREKYGQNRSQERKKELQRSKKQAMIEIVRSCARNIQSQSAMELNCPICMELMVSPVSTPCGHTFCWQCLDEAFTLSTICPVCRLSIQKINFVTCIELQSLIVNFIKKTNPALYQQYMSKVANFQKWLTKRYVRIERVRPSDIIDVRDTQGIWCDAVVKNIIKIGATPSLLIHYIGWSNLYDEVLQVGSQRMATHRFYTGRSKLPRYELVGGQQLQGYVLGVDQGQREYLNMESEDQMDFDQEIRIMSQQESESISSEDSYQYQVEDVHQSSRQIAKHIQEDI